MNMIFTDNRNENHTWIVVISSIAIKYDDDIVLYLTISITLTAQFTMSHLVFTQNPYISSHIGNGDSTHDPFHRGHHGFML